MKKLHIDYRMERGSKLAESVVELPISEERYAELVKGIKPESEEWRNIQTALETLAFLQGYKLGSWNIELEIQDDTPSVSKGKHACKYCGEVTDGTDEDVLCGECRGTFGHAFYSEL